MGDNSERVGEKELSETDYDALIVDNVDIVCDALRHASVLDERSDLRVIARQFEGIDVLFAETHGDELVRLVIVEDKLFRNLEQHRKVLAQLLDYAHRLQYEVELDALIAKADSGVRDLLNDNREALARILRTGDFLLLVAGDRVQPRLVNFMTPLLDRRDHAMSRFEMGLLSLALYRHGDELVLVPNVVGAISRSERDLCLEVVVKAAGGDALPATVSVRDPAPSRKTEVRLKDVAWSRETLLAQTRQDLGLDAAPTVKMLTALLDFAGERPFGIRWGRGKKLATFDVVVRSPSGDAPIVSAASDGWVMINGRDIAEHLGEEVKRRELAALDDGLKGVRGKPIAVENPYPYLPAEFGTSEDPRHFEALTTFLRRVADAIGAANRLT